MPSEVLAHARRSMDLESLIVKDPARRTSKFREEFDEVERIGRGAFGSVYKCKNKFDGKLYAIKKVKLKNSKDAWTRADTEVKALANLQHKAIVRYHTAWVEEGLPTEIARLVSVELSTGEGNLSSDTFESTDEQSLATTTQAVDETGDSGVPQRKTSVLFIQMELCGTTLKDWMQNRNQSCESEEDFLVLLSSGECLTIFKQILQAVECIHDQNVIHRDLKPQNVFMLENKHVKVGDFGLATPDILSNDSLSDSMSEMCLEAPNSSSLTAGVGTPTYAAPEQLDSSKYTNKSDIYSLGVILFELYQKFDTEMERGKTLGSLRDGIIPETVTECWPVLTDYISKMTSHDPETRPSAKEILTDSKLFLSKKQIIAELKLKEEKDKKCIKQHETALKRLNKDLNKKKKAVESMRQKSGEYAIEILNLKHLVKRKDEIMQSEVESQLVRRISAKEKEYLAEIERLKKLLSKKNDLLKKKDRALREKDALIHYWTKELQLTEKKMNQ